MILTSADIARFWVKVIKKEGCWEWTASLDPDGYGQFWLNGRPIRAHRVAYTLLVGPIPEGMEIDHLCRNRACVNPAPDHMEVTTHAVNTLRGTSPQAVNARKTHCSNGHPFDKSNTYTQGGRRHCRACNAARVRAYNERKKAA